MYRCDAALAHSMQAADRGYLARWLCTALHLQLYTGCAAHMMQRSDIYGSDDGTGSAKRRGGQRLRS